MSGKRNKEREGKINKKRENKTETDQGTEKSETGGDDGKGQP